MKTKLLFVNVLLFIFSLQLNGQVSFGIKAGVINKTLSDKQFNMPTFEKKGVYSNVVIGESISGLAQIEFNKFLSIVMEPGLQIMEHNYFSQNEHILELCVISDYTRPIYFESPIKLKTRLPLFKNRVGIFSSFGVNPNKQLFVYVDSEYNDGKKLQALKTKLNEHWELSKLLGFGIDARFGRHIIVLDLDFTRAESRSIDSEWRNNSTQVGVGYLFTI